METCASPEDLFCIREIRGCHGTINHVGSEDLSLSEVGPQRIDTLGISCDGSIADCIDAWSSPRISFSQDFVMDNASPIIRVSPEKRKWDQDDNEFEFNVRSDNPNNACIHDNGECGHTALDDKELSLHMLSADKLFCDGKLLPLHISSKAYDDERDVHPKHNDGDDDGNTLDNQQQQRCRGNLVNLERSQIDELSKAKLKSMARHLSFDHSESHPTTSHDTDAVPASPSSAMMSSLTLISPSPSPPTMSSSLTSTSPLHQSLASTYSARFKTLFKSSSKCMTTEHHIMSPISTNNAGRDVVNTNSSRKMIPMYMAPMSFWPFSRSNSAGEKKSTSIPHCLSYRSNSAGETSSSSKAIISNRSHLNVAHMLSNTLLNTDVKAVDVGLTREECTKKPSRTPAANGEPGSLLRHSEEGEEADEGDEGEEEPPCHTKIKDHHGNEADGDDNSMNWLENINVATGTMKVQRSGNASKASSKKSKSVCSANPPSKIVLKNLERCCAEKKLGWKQLNRRGSFPVATRVSPVLNVAIYRGGKNPTSNSNGFFGSLFTNSKKEPKPKEGALNWRKGA